MKASTKSTPIVQSVDRALELLEALADAKQELALGELSAMVDLHSSTAHRLLSTMLNRGFVRQNPATRKYSLGLKVLEVGNALHYQANLRAIASPFLEQLVEKSRESANLAILDQDEAVCIDQVQADRLVVMFNKIGRRLPLHCTGMGKVLLAYLPPDRVDQILQRKGLSPLTHNTITNQEVLRQELEGIRLQGWAMDDEEYESGTRCFASPISDSEGEVVAAISISGPSSRLTPDRYDELVQLVKSIAKEISLQLGYKDTSITCSLD